MNNTQFYIGVVENRIDPLKLGRCQVRVVGVHTHDKALLPTEDLPWAQIMQPANSAAMNGIGHTPLGPVEGTSVLVMFYDPPDNQQPMILGSVGGIPQADSVIVDFLDDDDPIIRDPLTGREAPAPGGEAEAALDAPASTQSNTPVDADQESITPNSDSLDSIPLIPPPWWRGNIPAATRGINAIIEACKELGFDSKEQVCSLLGIIGGESNWIPQNESFNYSAPRLQEVFKRTFEGKPELAETYARWKGTRETFFNFVYAPENNGNQLGNTLPNDGGLFYGRGLIQITGRSNYETYSRLAKVDIVNNPDILNTNLEVSARVAVAYLQHRVSPSVIKTDHPGYFYAAKRAVGNNTPDIAALKLAYYEYFYGAPAPESVADSSRAAGTAPPSGDTTAAGAGSISGGSTDSMGFKDPNNKYPLKGRLKEPDTNRLARSIAVGTVVPIKESKRLVGIEKAIDQGTYNQPFVPYGAQYPYNHVYESESGHVMEFDDTPGYERIHQYHRAGTFTEIDPNGTEVHRIVGDGYTIIDRNGCIYIAGECNITTDGKINILCRSTANIEVTGDVNMNVGGNYKLGVRGDMEVSVGGRFAAWSVGDMSMQTPSDIHMKSGSSIFAQASSDLNLKAGSSFKLDGGSTSHIKAPTLEVDSFINLSSGAAASASAADTVQLIIPTVKSSLNSTIPYLESPQSIGEGVYEFEDEDEWNTEAGRAARAEIIKKYGDENPSNTPAQDEARAVGGTDQVTFTDACMISQSTQNFTADFKLSPNITLGMMFDGGFNVKHKLRDQVGLTKQQIVCNLSLLCQNVIEKYIPLMPGGMAGYGKLWRINSGYRMGDGKSDHCRGRAFDIGLIGGSERKQKHFELIKQMEAIVPYDQIILEYRTPGQTWIHTSFRGMGEVTTSGGGKNRKMAFTMLNDKTYGQGFILL